MSPVLIVTIVLGLLVVAALVKAVRVVPEMHVEIVERFGRYSRTLTAGVNTVVPFADSVRHRIDLREQVVPFPPQPVFTRDNVVVNIDTVIYYQVTDPRAATYEVASYIQAIEQRVITTLRILVGSMDLERTMTSRAQTNADLDRALDEVSGQWGIRVNRVELKAIEPPTSIQDSMEKQMRADRDKRAAILHAEGVRQSAILVAEGERRAALTKAETDRDVAAILGQRTGPAPENGSAPGTPTPSASTPSRLTPSVPAQSTPVAPRLRHEALRAGDPRRIGRYNLTARLGQGGMGTVFLGRSPGERMVAVKVIHAAFAADSTFRQRFAREIEAARRVGGFHTAAVVDADADAEHPWFVTEYIPGPSLHEVLGLHGAMPPRTLYALALGVAEALEGIHTCGIVHRDLKPSNIIVSTTGPRVIDFGIARAFDSTSLTSTNVVVGTQGFLAPEQLAGAACTSAADLYAYGMVLCHAAGAVPLPEGESLESALALLPANLVHVITRCLTHDPARRPTCSEVLEQLTETHRPSGDWLPPPVRTMVDLHSAPTV